MRRLIYIALILLLPVGVWGQTVQIDTLYCAAHADSGGGLTGFDQTPSYENARATTPADYHSATNLTIGQDKQGDGDFGVYRAFIMFPSIQDIIQSSDIDSAKLVLDGSAPEGGADFDYTVYSSWFDVSGSGFDANKDFNNFDGWKAGLNAYTGIALTDSLADSEYNAGANIFTFNANGLDTLDVHRSGFLKIVVMSIEDVKASEPADAELLTMEGVTESNKPFLIIYSLAAEEGYTVTSARGNVIHEARGHVVKGLDDLRKVAWKFLNMVIK